MEAIPLDPSLPGRARAIVGRSWRSLADAGHSPSAANIHGLTVDPTTPGGALVGTDTGEVWRVSPDAEWELLAADLPAVLSLLTIG